MINQVAKDMHRPTAHQQENQVAQIRLRPADQIGLRNESTFESSETSLFPRFTFVKSPPIGLDNVTILDQTETHPSVLPGLGLLGVPVVLILPSRLLDHLLINQVPSIRAP